MSFSLHLYLNLKIYSILFTLQESYTNDPFLNTCKLFLHLDTKYLIIHVQFGGDEYCNLFLVVQLSFQKKSLLLGPVHCERIRDPDPQWTDPTDRQHCLQFTRCCLKKKHTAQERELPQEKAHSIASEDSTEEEGAEQKEGLKTKKKTIKLKEIKKQTNRFFFLDRKNSKHETHIKAELHFFSLFFLILFPIKCLMLELYSV